MTFLTHSSFSELLFMAGMRRSAVSALHWADLANAPGADSILFIGPRSKSAAGLQKSTWRIGARSGQQFP